ncbi:MAG: GNAT family N-acetyltransferase [Candidatus Dojkabacteria bacterium]|nr:MAG: GNAT family N-acetyltransferase [Candidatus Dojkabacteria bacterium]
MDAEEFSKFLKHGMEYQGKGYATEALNRLIEFCFSLEGVHKIFGECDKENIASQRIMEKCGMKFEREVEEGDGVVSIQFSIEK